MFEEFGYERFVNAPNEELRHLLAGLRDAINRRISEVLEPQFSEDQQVQRFHAMVEQICEGLAKQGHFIGPFDYDPDPILVRNSQTWGSHYRDCGPNGLEIVFKPNVTSVLWVVSPHDENKPGF